jgi:large subunit ribosomal protein L17
MRHKKKTPHLSRTSSHRKAMFGNMAVSLIMHKRITTTLAKAKALRSFIEPLITKSKEDTTHSRRLVFAALKSKEAVSELFREVAVKVQERPGGYTRILKLGPRLGDNAEMAIIELVDYNELMQEQKKDQPTRSSRRRRGGKKKSTETPVAETTTVENAKAEEPEAKEEKPEADAKEKPETKAEEPVKEEEKPEEKKEEKAEEKKEEKAEEKKEEKAEEKKEEKPEEKKEEEPKEKKED